MQKIEVDFEVFKELTQRRVTESETYNNVIKKLLGIKIVKPDKNDWIVKGVRFPVNTEFFAMYKGQRYTGIVESGALVVNGQRYNSPSAAAMSITTRINGWLFWYCRTPESGEWERMSSFKN